MPDSKSFSYKGIQLVKRSQDIINFLVWSTKHDAIQVTCIANKDQEKNQVGFFKPDVGKAMQCFKNFMIRNSLHRLWNIISQEISLENLPLCLYRFSFDQRRLQLAN